MKNSKIRKQIINASNNKWLLIFGIALILLVIAAMIIFRLIDSSQGYRIVKNDTYSTKYDRNWNLKVNSDTQLGFEHSSGGTLDIFVNQLGESNTFDSIDELANKAFYEIESKNKNLLKVSSKNNTATKLNLKSIQNIYTFENNDSVITVFKYEDKIVIVNYTAPKNVSDILLSSESDIMNNFELITKVASSDKVDDITTTGINFKSDKVDYSKAVEYEIFNEKYNVKYSIPEQFTTRAYDTTTGYYASKDTKNPITIATKVIYGNLYEYITRDNYSIKSTIDGIKKSSYNKDVKIENRKESKNGLDGYVYKISYKTTVLTTTTSHQTVTMAYSLDNIKTFVIEINSSNYDIPENMINKIAINSRLKYGSNIVRDVDGDGMITGKLRTMLAGNSPGYNEISYSFPQKYTEIDYKQNQYVSRYFGLGYDESSDKYKYNIMISIDKSGSIDKLLKLYTSSRSSEFSTEFALQKQPDFTINSKAFHQYSTKNVKKSNNETIYDKLAVTELENGEFYTVQIHSDNASINEEIIKDFTLFEFKINKK